MVQRDWLHVTSRVFGNALLAIGTNLATVPRLGNGAAAAPSQSRTGASVAQTSAKIQRTSRCGESRRAALNPTSPVTTQWQCKAAAPARARGHRSGIVSNSVIIAGRLRRHPSLHKLRRWPAAAHLHLLLPSESFAALPSQS